MTWWGTLLGGTLGYMFGGPLGALLGAILGRNFGRGLGSVERPSMFDPAVTRLTPKASFPRRIDGRRPPRSSLF